MPTKKTRSKLVKDTDKYFSTYIRYRDGKKQDDGWYSQCITCDVWKPHAQMQAGHFQTRAKYSTRWDEENVNAQCVGCNMFKAGEQYKHGKAIDLKYGDGTAEKLVLKSNQILKIPTWELEEIINNCKEQIKEYEEQ